MEGPPDWDLLAVVRSCNNTATTTSTTTASQFPDHQQPPVLSVSQQQDACSPSSSEMLFRFSTPFDTPATTTSFLSGQQELQDICKPLICTTNTAPTTSSSNSFNNFQSVAVPVSSSSLSSSVSLSSPVSSSSSFIPTRSSFGVSEQPHLRRLINKPTQVIFGGAHPPVVSTSTAATTPQAQRAKKRKNLMKKVCHVPAEGLSSDMWAWRKYGQKPIKGSPYPRGYYRCSSSKGCLARKQVERNRSDPKMFIVTYTSEHNHPMPTHRNSLAGSTRQKPLTTVSGDGSGGTPPEQPTCSSPSAASLSPLTEKSESKTEGEDQLMKEENEGDNNTNTNDDDNEMGLSDLMLNDDFYVGFEQIDGDDGSDCFSDSFSPSMEFPWLANSSSTATAAGGS